jgi:hypothetical protein
MRTARKGISAAILALVAVVLVLGGALGYYYVSTDMTVTSLDSENSSYASGLSNANRGLVSASSTISSQQSEIQCLQSEISSMNGTVATGQGSATCGTVNYTTSSGPNPIILTGTLTVPSGSGIGTLVVNVKNVANVSITAVSVDIVNGALEAPNGTVVFFYHDAALSISNPLPPGGYTAGNATVISGVSQLDASYGYIFNVTISYLDGTSQVEQLYVTAEV